MGADEFSWQHGTTYHIHILETKTQAVTGREFYGKTLIRYMHDLGALSERTTIAHSIWVTDEDIELMGKAGCSVSHNPISNQKLGPASRLFASSGRWRERRLRIRRDLLQRLAANLGRYEGGGVVARGNKSRLHQLAERLRDPARGYDEGRARAMLRVRPARSSPGRKPTW